MKYKVSDMTKEYIINFLQEYSFYIKSVKKDAVIDNYVSVRNIMCPTEFFNSTYLDILKETEEFNPAFGIKEEKDHEDQIYMFEETDTAFGKEPVDINDTILNHY